MGRARLAEERFYPDAAKRIRQGLRDIRAHHPMGGFLVMDGEEVVGSIIYYLHYSPYPQVVRPTYFDLAYVCGMFVAPAYRRQGIARRLMEHTTCACSAAPRSCCTPCRTLAASTIG
jgi:GNAT superfamily N-acetyltransferase